MGNECEGPGKMEKHEYLGRNYSNFDMGWSVWERQRKA